MEQPQGTGHFCQAQSTRSSKIECKCSPGCREHAYEARAANADAGAQAAAGKFAGKQLAMIDRVEISIVEERQPRRLALLIGADRRLRTATSRQSRTRTDALRDFCAYVDRNSDGWRSLPDGAPTRGYKRHPFLSDWWCLLDIAQVEPQ